MGRGYFYGERAAEQRMGGKIERARRFGMDTFGEVGDLLVRAGRTYDFGGRIGEQKIRWRFDAAGGILRPAVVALVAFGEARGRIEDDPSLARPLWRRLFYAGVGTVVEILPYDGKTPFSLVWGRAHRVYEDSPFTYTFLPVLPLTKLTPRLLGELRRAGIAAMWVYGERWPYPYGRRGTEEFIAGSGLSVLYTSWSPVCGGGSEDYPNDTFIVLPEEPVHIVEEGVVIAGNCPKETLFRVFCALGKFLANVAGWGIAPLRMPGNCSTIFSKSWESPARLSLPEEAALLGRPTLQSRLYRLLGLYPERGRLTPGAVADVVLFPPHLGTRPPRLLVLEGTPYLLVRSSTEKRADFCYGGGEDATDRESNTSEEISGCEEREEPPWFSTPLAVWGPPWGRGYYLRASCRWSHARFIKVL